MLLHLKDLETGTSNGGRMWVSIGEECFPEEGWYDLPGIVLEWWRNDIRTFGDGVTDFCELIFMDGPYRIRLRRTEGRIYATCLDAGHIVIEPVEIDFAAFCRSVP